MGSRSWMRGWLCSSRGVELGVGDKTGVQHFESKRRTALLDDSDRCKGPIRNRAQVKVASKMFGSELLF
jgi:hypothetical protein